jgi:hypothetical protein
MKPDHILTKRHGISDYLAVAPAAAGFIYVETDRYLPSALPSINVSEEDEEVAEKKIREWAHEPLEEIRFLRRIVEGTATESEDGVQQGQQGKLKGVVLYAPLPISTQLFKTYLHIARDTAGPALWAKVVGFRYLLQGKVDGEVERLVSSEDWLSNMLELGKSEAYGGKKGGWAFDVGADVNRDGVDGLIAVGKMVGEVRRRERERSETVEPVRFVLSKLLISLFLLLPCFLSIQPLCILSYSYLSYMHVSSLASFS